MRSTGVLAVVLATLLLAVVAIGVTNAETGKLKLERTATAATPTGPGSSSTPGQPCLGCGGPAVAATGGAGPGPAGPSLSLAAPQFAATTLGGLLDTQLTATVRNGGSTPLVVSASDFLVSAQGDIFGARGWSGGSGGTTIAPGGSRVFRLTFALPEAAATQAALYYRLANAGAPSANPLAGSLRLTQPSSPASGTQPSIKTSAAAPLAAQPTVNTFPAGGGVGEPWGTAIDGAGNIWFAEPGCDFAPGCASNTAPGQIGEFKASTHTFVFFTLPNITGNQPIFLAFDGSGNIWFTTPNNSMIGEFNPSTGQFVGQWSVTAGTGPWDLTFAGGKIWYTEHLVSAVGSFDPSAHTHQDFQTPTANTNPYGITANGGLIWFTENNSNVDRIASLDTTKNNTISEYLIEATLNGHTPHLIVLDSHGNPWWSEGFSKAIATLNPAAATPGQCGATSGNCNGIQRFLSPTTTNCSTGTHVSGIAIRAATGLVWFDNSLTAQVGSFNPANSAFAMTSLSNCGAHPHDGLNVDGAGNVWFDEEFANALGELIPPTPPTVKTEPASAISQTSATLNATVNPNGSEVSECKLEYGTTTSYGSSAPCTPAPGSGTSAVAVSAAIASLTANTTYHFRIAAINVGGTSTGEDQTLKTLPNAPTVKTEPASAVNQNSATLNATVNPNGGEVSECKLEYGTTTSYGKSASCAPAPGSGTSNVAVSAAVSSLTANTTYHFRISATNAGGTSTGADAEFKTTAAPLPTVKTEPASAVGQAQATLNATVNPNGSNVSSCKFEYGTTTAYGQTAPCAQTVGSGTSNVSVSAAVSSLTVNTTYHFRISATNAGGTSTGADATLKTLPSAPTVKTEPASSVAQTTATLNATVNPNGAEVSECKLEYGTSISYGKSATCTPAPGSGSSAVAVSAAVSSLTANTTYHFRVSATNAGGTSTGADQTLKTLPNAPTVKTEPASSVAQTSATLNATVNPNAGNVSECRFEYGTTTAYGQTAACAQTVGSGTSNVAVSAAVSALSPNTTYHFRISATNPGGTSTGADQTLKTLAAAPTVTTEPASAVSQTTATLNATVNPNGAEVTTCKFEYGTSTSYTSSASCSPAPGSGTSAVAVSAAISSLTANTTYHFRIVATNAGGTSTGTDQTLKTLPNAPTVKTEPASAVSQTAATLNATVNPNGGEVSECKLEYGTSTSYGSSAPCSPAPGSGTSTVSVSAAVSSLTANTTYHFRISATNAGGTSTGADATLKTLPNAPTVKTELASAVSQTAATLNATVNPNGGEVGECKFEYGTSTSYSSSATCSPAPGSGSSAVSVSAAVSSLTANTTYHFRISATNAGGTSTGADQTLKTLPNAPTVKTEPASAVSQTTATLNATVNPNGGEVSECKLEYGTTTSYGSSASCSPAPGSGSSAVSVSAAITSLTANTTYHFRISAANAGGTSTGADQTLNTLPNTPTVKTEAASPVAQNSATLNATVNPNGAEVSECKFEYGTSTSYNKTATCSPAPGSGTSAVSVSAAIASLVANTTYHFRIVATNAGGTSTGADATLKTLPKAPTVKTEPASSVAQTTATLNATVNPNGGEVSECKLEYGTTTAYGSIAACTPAPGSGSSAVAVSAAISGLTANTIYHFRISATNAGGTSTGADQTLKTLPNAPTVKTEPASAVSQTAATLNATVNPNGSEVSECKLEYGTTTAYGSSAPCSPAPGSGSSAVAVSAAIASLTANTTYHFRISATNAGGTSTGADQTLKTLPNAPTVKTEPASAVSQTSATLNATVNPNGAEVSECKLEYGATTAYGSSAACTPAPGEGTSNVAVSAAISGLTANTTYHFRISATNAGGTSTGADQTLKTLPNAPTVKTEPASAVSQTTATLNATVNPNGGEVSECKLEYGTTTSYGSSTPCTPAPGEGTSNVPVSAAVTGLAENTLYHFRISATNAGGTSTGSDQTLKTLPSAPTVKTEAASSVAQNSATLNASVNPNGAEVSECKFEYGTTTSYGKTATCSPAPGSGTSAVAVSAAISSLTANTTYHFRIAATNAGGTSTSADATLKTLPKAPTVKTEPASAISQTTATLNATVNPNGGEVSECQLEYGTSTSYGSSAACSPAPGSGSSTVAVSAAISGLTANATYHFRIVATNPGGTSTGADQTLKTLPNAPTVKTEPASEVRFTSANLNAIVNPNGSEVSECKLEYGTTTAYGSSATCSPAPGQGTSNVAVSAAISGLIPSTTYHFRIVATNAGGTSMGLDESFTTTASPVAPTVKTEAASSVAQTTATLNATVNPNGFEVSECKLEYGISTSYGSSAPCTPAPGSGSSAVAVSAAISTLTANTTYHFRISATNAGGTSTGADQTLKTLPNAPTVKTEPASSVAQTTATLNAIVNPNGGEVSECKLEYGTTTSYGSIAPCTPAPGEGTSNVAVSAAVTGLAENTRYHFRIVARNAGGTTEGADETFKTTITSVTPTVKTEPASSVAQTSATLNATVNPNGVEVSECKFEYGTSTSYGQTAPCAQTVGSGSSAVAVSAAISTLTANTTYHFRIVATNGGGTSTGADQTLKTLPNAPTVKTELASSVVQTSATLNATVNPNGAEVIECKLEYGTTTAYGKAAPCSPAPGEGTGNVAVSAAISGLTPNTTYHFRVRATNAGGTSTGSDQTLKTLSAAPEFGRCLKVAAGAGEYGNASCTQIGGAKAYEWFPGVVKKTFTTKLTKGEVTFETVKGTILTCKGESGTGEYTSPKTIAGVVLKFSECEKAGQKCTTAGAPEGQMETNPLEGVLGVIAAGEISSKSRIGLELFPAGNAGAVLEFSCAGTAGSIRGAVIVPVSRNVMQSSTKLLFATAKGKQQPEHFEGQPKSVLEASFGSGPFEQIGLRLEMTQVNQERVEVNSVV